MMRSLLLLCAMLSASALLLKKNKKKWTSPEVVVDDATARVYVMNMAENPERCECMQTQLFNSPFPVERFEGANHHHKKSLKQCKEVERMNLHTNPEQKANIPTYLTCTNYQIWKHAMNETQPETDFIVIFEDDATLKHSGGPKFWDKVQKMMNTCDGFDYLSVDTFGGPGETILDSWGPDREGWFGSLLQKEDSGDVCTFEPLKGWGAHMQIIRRSVLPMLISTVRQGQWGPMDHWNEFTSSIRKHHWNANIVRQSSQDTHKVAHGCSKKHMKKSTLGNLKAKDPIDMSESETATETKAQAFQCAPDPRKKNKPTLDDTPIPDEKPIPEGGPTSVEFEVKE